MLVHGKVSILGLYEHSPLPQHCFPLLLLTSFISTLAHSSNLVLTQILLREMRR